MKIWIILFIIILGIIGIFLSEIWITVIVYAICIPAIFLSDNKSTSELLVKRIKAVLINSMPFFSSGSDSKKVYVDSSIVGSVSKPPTGKVDLDVIKIGSQSWCVKNLDLSTYRNGDAIPEVQDYDEWTALTTGAWCYYQGNFYTLPNGMTAYGKSGKLYNWYAVSDPRGLAPKGYHIPSDAEWKKLIYYLGGENVAGTKMKSIIGWQNGNGNNESGFTGLPDGFRFGSGEFRFFGMGGYWWGSAGYSTFNTWYRSIGSSGVVIKHSFGYFSRYDIKRCGLSVRCLLD